MHYTRWAIAVVEALDFGKPEGCLGAGGEGWGGGLRGLGGSRCMPVLPGGARPRIRAAHKLTLHV